MYEHILIATDGSDLAKKGVDHGLKLAAKLGSKVTIVSVTEPIDQRAARAARLAGIEDPVGRYDQTVDEEMAKRFSSLRERAAAQGVTVELTHEIDEHPAGRSLRLRPDRHVVARQARRAPSGARQPDR